MSVFVELVMEVTGLPLAPGQRILSSLSFFLHLGVSEVRRPSYMGILLFYYGLKNPPKKQ